MTISKETKLELITFVLSNTSVDRFNLCIKSFDTSYLYRSQKMSLISTYKELLGCPLNFGTIMGEVFSQYKTNDIECKGNNQKLDRLKNKIKLYRNTPMAEQLKCYIKEYNDLVIIQNNLLKPQNELIKLYKQLR